MSVKYQTYQIKGYCKANGYRRLEEMLGQCATLYNAALQERRDAYRMARHRRCRGSGESKIHFADVFALRQPQKRAIARLSGVRV